MTGQAANGTVLVTGGAGFLGSWVCEAHRDAGWRVLALDDLSTGRASRVPRGVELIERDLRDGGLDRLLADRGVEVVSHHAARRDVRASLEAPGDDATVNVDGTLHLLEACAEAGVSRVVLSSSGGTVYGEPEEMPVPEDHPKRPDSPHGIAKLAAEHYARFYRRAHGLETVALRYANVYGPRQDPGGKAGVVATFADQLLGGRRLAVRGDGGQTRDYLHADDAARAAVLAARMPLPGARGIDDLAFNVGTGVETSVNELAEAIQRAAGRRAGVRRTPPRIGDLRRNALDATKLEGRGWTPRIRLEDGLQATLAWFEDEREPTGQCV